MDLQHFTEDLLVISVAPVNQSLTVIRVKDCSDVSSRFMDSKIRVKTTRSLGNVGTHNNGMKTGFVKTKTIDNINIFED